MMIEKYNWTAELIKSHLSGRSYFTVTITSNAPNWKGRQCGALCEADWRQEQAGLFVSPKRKDSGCNVIEVHIMFCRLFHDDFSSAVSSHMFGVFDG